jgi:hypothetical protein
MKELYPYDTLFGDVSVTVKSVEIDDHEIAGRIHVDQRLVDFEGLDRAQWETARLDFEVAGPVAELAALDGASAVAILNCGPSNTRLSIALTADDASAGHWQGSFELVRDDWYGQAELRCGIVATVDDVANRIVGWADSWKLAFDDLPSRPTIGGSIQITWVDFKEPGDDRKYLRRHDDKYCYLSIDPHEPQLFLNKSFPGLEALLVDRRRRAADKALHDQTRASIADKTWTALFNAALDFVELDEETDEPRWPDVEWQRTVLETLLASMYPDDAAEEALANAYTARHSTDAAGTLQELLAPAAGEQARAPRLLREGIRLLSNELSIEEEEQVS